MPQFTTEISLQGKNIFIKELKVKHFKILLKSLLGDNPNPENALLNIFSILEDITSLSKNELKDLSIIDFLILIVYIRCISIGSSIQLEVKDDKNTKITLNLNKVINTLEQINNYNYIKSVNDLLIEYQVPNIYNFLSFNDYNNDILIVKNHIKSLTFKNKQVLQISNIDNKTFQDIFNLLPANYSAEIFKHVTEIVGILNQINLLDYLNNENFILRLTSNTVIFILQILFSKNLYPLYENIFALCKFANLSPMYIEDCTPGEYIIYTKMLERFIKEQNAKNKPQSSTLIKNKSPEYL